MKKYYIILGSLQAITALGAIPAGLGYLMDTSGARMGQLSGLLKSLARIWDQSQKRSF